MRKSLYIKIIINIIIFIIIFSGKSYAENIIGQPALQNDNEIFNERNYQDLEEVTNREKELKDNFKIEVLYEYNEETNKVTAIINSNIELEDTKPTWKLSEDKKQYTKIFTSNTSYVTPVQDINGNITNIYIQITQIKKLTIELKYEYNEEDNIVKAIMSSNIKLEDTKPTWKLSEDGKQYTKIFTENISYETPVQDINGNLTNVKIEVIEIKEFEINVEYEYNKVKNQLMVKLISNMKLEDTKPTWELSGDRKQYTKIFTSNINYQTPVYDINGNVINVNINVDQIGKNKANISVEYEYDNKLNIVTAKIISDIELEDTKPTWTLSEDKLVYYKQFTENVNYSTPVIDVCGNIIDVNIAINKIDLISPQIKLEYKYNNDDTITVCMISNEILEDTKPTWILSEDKLTYSKNFDCDQNYITPVQDKYNNITYVKIQFKMRQFTYEQEDSSKIKVRYLYKEEKEVTVEIITSEKMLHTKPTWTLSDDGYKYSKTFYNNNIYITPIEYINGITHDVNIIINLFGNYITGIDVSKHQGKIDWQKVKNSGIEFAIIRCGFGQDRTSQDDEMFEYNVSECERLGIPYGVYLYSYAVDLNCANSEADHVLRLIKGKNPTYGIWYDLEEEVDEFDNPITNEMLVNIAITFCEKMKANGYDYVGIYANLNWFNNKLNDSRLDKYPKWVAQWNDECTYEKEYDMWQYTSDGQVDGINGRVDMNKYYKQR